MRNVKCTVYKKGQPKEVIGKFHQWGLETVEEGSYTVAIVETYSGEVVTALPTDVQFLEDE